MKRKIDDKPICPYCKKFLEWEQFKELWNCREHGLFDDSQVIFKQIKKNDKETIKLHFGALCEPLSRQLIDQGVALNDDGRFQNIADAITMLHLHRIISDSVTHKAQQKLMKQISDYIHSEGV
jgi:hypothetical protein